MLSWRRIIVVLCLLGFFAGLQAQRRVTCESYSVEDGLPQNSVSDMVRDKEGFVWFATRDGLCRFDGYSFLNYKASSKQIGRSVSNQFERLLSDEQGFIWVLNDIGQVLRFNPPLETFEIVPSIAENKGDNYLTVKRMERLLDGNVWLTGYSNGCVRITTDSTSNLSSTFFCTHREEKTGHSVHSLYCDADKRVWIMTDNGIALIQPGTDDPAGYFLHSSDSVPTPVFAMTELEGELVASASNGMLFRYDKNLHRFSEFGLGSNNDMNNIIAIAKHTCFVSTSNAGFFVVDLSTGEKKYQGTPCGRHLTGISASWKDANGDVWFKAEGYVGYFCYDVKQENCLYYPFLYQGPLATDKFSNSLHFFSFLDDRDGLWLLPKVKGNAQSTPSNRPYFKDDASGKQLYPKVVHRSFADTMGVVWFASSNRGLMKSVVSDSYFSFSQCENSSEYTESNDLLALMEDASGRLWISSQDGCVRLFGADSTFLGFLSVDGSIQRENRCFDDVHSIYQDRSGRVWLGAERYVYRLTPAGKSFLVRRYPLTNNSRDRNLYPVMDILEDSHLRIWLATKDGGLMLIEDPNATNVSVVDRTNRLKGNYPPSVLLTRCLLEDSYGNIWLGSNEGITTFSNEFEKPEDIKFFFYNSENSNLDNSCIYDIYQDSDGLMWFASFGGGLFQNRSAFYLGDTPDFISYSKSNKRFPSDLLLGIQEAEDGSLWVAAEDMIVRFDRKERVAEPFGKIRGVDNVAFAERAILKMKSGRMIVGSSSGFYSFSPNKMEQPLFVPQIVFTRFLLSNKVAQVGAAGSPLQKTVNNISELVLESDQKDFSIEYAALDFRNASFIQYAYKLDHFEDDWNYVGDKRVASYTNLPKGEYTFRVRSTNSEGLWLTNDRVLKVIVLPSFWETGWAIALYVFCGLLLAGVILYVLFSFYRLRSRMALDREMSALKLQFFTDVSHELRTPLTLIAAPLDNVLANGQLQERDKEQLEVVRTNANRMLRLMNQILDFRKIQNNKMRLRVERTRLGEFVASCSSNFLKIAENREVRFSISDNTNGATFWVDRDKIDTVIFNLLSNSFKFTPSGKAVAVSIFLENGECVIRVKDEGCGMPKNKIPVIFERFTTLQAYSLTRQAGTGIGLSLVKEIVDMHKATISVDSELNVGSTFEVRIKPGTDHFDDHSDIIICDDELPANTHTEGGVELSAPSQLTLLVVEDNEQLREFLVSILSKRFNVIEAPNGKVGLEVALREMPDFILTDIMMPEMDGVEMTRTIRENTKVSHIPVVLLTAKTDMQSKLECLRIGANDYITKPFSMAYLEARIDNILEERQKWQERYRRELMGSVQDAGGNGFRMSPDYAIGEEETSPIMDQAQSADDAFMKEVVSLIEKNLDNPQFSVDDIQDALKVSRWHLLSKVKVLLGITPNELIRETRLSAAAQLIRSGKYSMTQVAYMIGMTDSRYFSRCFKQKFGVTPTEYKEASEKA